MGRSRRWRARPWRPRAGRSPGAWSARSRARPARPTCPAPRPTARRPCARSTADPEGRPWSERKAYVQWDEAQGRWVGPDVPDFEPTKRPDYVPPEDATAEHAIGGSDPFIMQADGKGWLFVPSGLVDGGAYNMLNPVPGDPGADLFPYVYTTYRLTEHHTAGGMSRFVPYLSELQPAFFCEVSPELAAERGLEAGGWATIITARTAIEARVLVTDRMVPLRAGGKVIHQIGLPYHWGPNGISTGDAANELLSVALDPNVHIQDTKALTCDIQPGRRPRGPALLRYVENYRWRGGITAETGKQARTTGPASASTQGSTS